MEILKIFPILTRFPFLPLFLYPLFLTHFLSFPPFSHPFPFCSFPFPISLFSFLSLPFFTYHSLLCVSLVLISPLFINPFRSFSLAFLPVSKYRKSLEMEKKILLQYSSIFCPLSIHSFSFFLAFFPFFHFAFLMEYKGASL